jgi:iron complex outermembrane receptor protein
MRKLVVGGCLSFLFWGQAMAGEDAPKAKEAEEAKMTRLGEDGVKELTIRGKKIEQAKKGESAYLPEETTGVMKIPMKTTETPASVQIITPGLIDDQDSFRLQDVLRNVAGVSPEKNEAKGQEYETSSIRGFSQRIYRSGIRTLGSNTLDLNTVERVEVIKGPDAVTYGDAEPGGIINVVTKGAKLAPYKTKVATTVGSYDDYRVSLDTGGAIASDKALRVNLSYVNKDSFRDHVGTESYSVAPAFLWQIGDRTTLDVRLSHKHEERMLDPGVYFDINHKAVASIDTFLGEPDTDGMEIDDSLVDFTLTNEFLPWLTMRTRAVHHDLSVDLEAIRIRGNPDAKGMLGRRYDASDIRIKEYTVSNDFILKFDTGTFANTLLLGVEARHVSKNWHSKQDNTTLSKISIKDPVYDFNYDTLKIVDAGDDDEEVEAYALYLQDTLAMLDEKLHIMFGARLDKVNARKYSNTNTKTTGNTRGASGQFGVLYKLFPHFSPYATISTSFNPQSAGRVDVNGNYLNPETGIQYEGGFKSPFWKDKFVFTASVYRIDKQDVAIKDKDNTDYYINGGEMRSEGFELTAQGDFLPNWNIYASYAYMDTEVIKSDSLPVGAAFQGIPLHSGSIWVVHTHNEGKFAGLRLGGGLFAVGNREGDDNNTYELDGYVTVNLMAGYKKELASDRVLSAQLNLKNLFDEEYYESGGSYSVMPGAPRALSLNLGFEF